MAPLVVLGYIYGSASLQLLVLHIYEELHYEKPHCAIIVLMLCCILGFRYEV